jgi:hypothetical protein
MHDWEPTKHGGFRRTGEAQRAGETRWQSAVQMKQRPVVRSHPPVLTWAEKLGLPECPYVIRWTLQTRVGSLRVHRWLGQDDDRANHDHPWWFLTFVVRGGYTDRSPHGDEVLAAPAVRFRPALHQHTVIPGPRGAWTVMVTGPKTRLWGFWTDGKFLKANKWFARFGHHPCT